MTTHHEAAIGAIVGCAITIIGAYIFRWCWKENPPPATMQESECLDMDALLWAHGMAESSNGNPDPYWDRKQKSWGRYSFGLARWTECGGESTEWGRAHISAQDRVMRMALDRYLHKCPHADVESRVIWTANYHNLGHGSLKRTAHAEKVLNFYKGKIK